MVEMYLEKIANCPDYQRTAAWVMGGHEMDGALFEIDERGVGTQLGTVYLNKNPVARLTTTQHFMAATWWFTANYAISTSRHYLDLKPTFFEIEPWMDYHIDTQDHWDQAEYWFEKKILSQGEDCYERYRESWHDRESVGKGSQGDAS